MEPLRPLFVCQGLQPFPKLSPFFILRKIDIIKQGLDIKAGSSGHNGNPPPSPDLFHGRFRQFLKANHVKILLRIQHINKVMGDSSHLFFFNLRRSDIHPPVYLHGISGNNFSVHGFRKLDGKLRLSHSRGTCQYDQWLFHRVSSCPVLLNLSYFNINPSLFQPKLSKVLPMLLTPARLSSMLYLNSERSVTPSCRIFVSVF